MSYQCNCGKEFSHPHERTMHATNCEVMQASCTHTFHRLGGIDDCPVCNPQASESAGEFKSEFKRGFEKCRASLPNEAELRYKHQAPVIRDLEDARKEITRLHEKIGRLATRASIGDKALTKMIDLHLSGIAETSLLIEIVEDAFIELRSLTGR